MDDVYEQLIRKITGIGFDIDTDFPRLTQIASAHDGVMHFFEYEEDDEGYINNLPIQYEGTFAEALQAAISCSTRELTFDGLSRDEAVQLLLSPDYRTLTTNLVNGCPDMGGLAINGTRFYFEKGQLINEEFGVWPFKDESE
jgi:hypothetical protein